MTIIINDETWLDQAEFAEYINRGRSALPDVLRRYQDRTGKTLEKIQNKNSVYVRLSEVEELVRILYPFLARKNGLI